MVVDRRTFSVKPGKQDEVVELIKKAAFFSPFTISYRIYTPYFARTDEVILEIEFQDLAECDRYWAGWLQKVTPEWGASWNNLVETGGKAEAYVIVSG
jgi:hypothetical protein